MCLSQVMQILVSTLEGNTITIEPDSEDSTINSIKEKIQDKEGIPADRYYLTFESKKLSDDSTLAENNIKKGDTLRMSATLPGGVKGIIKKVTKERDDSKVARTHQHIRNLVKQVSDGVRSFPSVIEVNSKLDEFTSNTNISPKDKIEKLIGNLSSRKIQLVLDVASSNASKDAKLTKATATLFQCEEVADIGASIDAVLESAQLVLIQIFDDSQMTMRDFKQLLTTHLHKRQGAESASSSMIA